MIRSILFTAMATALMVSCNSSKGNDKVSDATTNVENGVTIPTDAPVVAGDVVYVDLGYLYASCKLSLVEGTELMKKVDAYEAEYKRVEAALQGKDQAIVAEFAKNEENYRNTMITSITYKNKYEELERRYAELQESKELEVARLAEKERAIAEEKVVLANRFADSVKRAVDNINSDKKYKMVVTSDMIISADESLNISALVLAEMDRLYDEGELN